MKKNLFMLQGFLYMLLLTSCEIDRYGNMSMSGAGWIIIIIFGLAAIIWVGKIASYEAERQEQIELNRKIRLNKQLEEYRKEQEAKEKALKEKYTAILEEYKDCVSLEIEVKGIFARSARAKGLVPYLNVDDEIKLRKEPSNPYDPFAVKVMSDRIHLGYVPAENSEFVTGLIDRKAIKKVIVSNAGDAKLNSWDSPEPYLDLTILYKE